MSCAASHAHGKGRFRKGSIAALEVLSLTLENAQSISVLHRDLRFRSN